MDLALSNENEQVESTTRLAASQPPSTAIKTLSTLHGIGPATASALVALFDPLNEPFFSDEAVEAVGMGKATYTVKALNQYRTAMQARQAEGKWESMEELERACWSFIVLRNLEGQSKTAKKETVSVGEASSGSGKVKGKSATKTRVAKTPYDRVAKDS